MSRRPDQMALDREQPTENLDANASGSVSSAELASFRKNAPGDQSPPLADVTPGDRPVKRRRRWTSISLRGLMVLILIVGGLMGWQARRASLQRRAVARIKTLRGYVTYDWEYGGNGFSMKTPSTSPPGPEWLRRAIGDEYFQDVAGVSMLCVVPPSPPLPPGVVVSVTDKDLESHGAYVANYERPYVEDQLACLDGLDRIEGLSLWVHNLKPEGWARLARQNGLKDLHLTVDKLDAEARAALAQLTVLEVLTIRVMDGNFGDLALLDPMSNLRCLWLEGAPMTDADLAAIRRRDRLEVLNIHGPDLTDAGMTQLAGIGKLKRLWIYSAGRVTDAGVGRFKTLGDLWELNLPATRLTDKGLEDLRECRKLTDAYFSGVRITNRVVERMEGEQPGLYPWFFPNPLGLQPPPRDLPLPPDLPEP